MSTDNGHTNTPSPAVGPPAESDEDREVVALATEVERLRAELAATRTELAAREAQLDALMDQYERTLTERGSAPQPAPDHVRFGRFRTDDSLLSRLRDSLTR